MRSDMKALGDAVILAVRSYVGRAVAGLSDRLDDFDSRLKALPHPERGEKGDDGKSVTLDEVLPVIREAVTREVAALPAPQNGADADPAVIAEMVAKAVAEIPKPKDGLDFDPDLLRAEVAKAVGELPPAANGKDADAAAIAKDVLDQVTKVLEDIPVPKDGKDADPELVRAEVERAIAVTPKPKDGESIPLEQVQRMVDDAVDDAVGKALAAVRMPEDGRDAAHLEILPAIDETKAYPRSTYAKHAGGLWRSFETTCGMKGWENIVEGEADFSFVQDESDPRTVTLTRTLSSGRTLSTQIYIPMVVDQGVFREGQPYKKGDGCTWGRHYWIARMDTTSKPEPGPAWRLAVKSGRDGRDANTVPRGGHNGPLAVG